jgi:hypothetical protein
MLAERTGIARMKRQRGMLRVHAEHTDVAGKGGVREEEGREGQACSSRNSNNDAREREGQSAHTPSRTHVPPRAPSTPFLSLFPPLAFAPLRRGALPCLALALLNSAKAQPPSWRSASTATNDGTGGREGNSAHQTRRVRAAVRIFLPRARCCARSVCVASLCCAALLRRLLLRCGDWPSPLPLAGPLSLSSTGDTPRRTRHTTRQRTRTQYCTQWHAPLGCWGLCATAHRPGTRWRHARVHASKQAPQAHQSTVIQPRNVSILLRDVVSLIGHDWTMNHTPPLRRAPVATRTAAALDKSPVRLGRA